MADNASDKDYQQVYWHSRRGMLELDLVLMPFAENCYRQLAAQDKEKYRRLLECEDQDMFSWLLRRVEPDDADITRIVQMILDYALSTDR